STVELSMFLFNLCWALRLESGTRHSEITRVLKHHSLLDVQFFSDVFWNCMSAVHDLTLTNKVRKRYVATLKFIKKDSGKSNGKDQFSNTLFDQLFAGKRYLQALDAAGRVQAAQDSDRCFPEFEEQTA